MTLLPLETLQNWDISSRREWLVTNGIGGYGSASIAGANTRRYHGLLVAALLPPLGRTVVLSKLEEEVRIEDQKYFLSSNKYPSVLYPQGYRHLTSFENDPITTFIFVVHESSVEIQKQVWMAHGKNTVYVRYVVTKAPEPITLSLSPFMDYKDYHTEQHKWDGFIAQTEDVSTDTVKFTATGGARPVFMSLTPAETFSFEHDAGWYYNYEHEREEERGQDAFEDLYCPGHFTGVLAQGRSVTFVATVESDLVDSPQDALAAELARIDKLVKDAQIAEFTDPNVRSLVLASDQFVIPKSDAVNRATVIAGYPWFTDWGRDTMISLPGLCLATHRFDTAREIIQAFANAMQGGLIPNRFTDDAQGAEFNTVDATLWLFQAAYQYAQATGDWAFLTGDLFKQLSGSIDAHVKGTSYSIHVDTADGLLYAGEHGVQLTWMDAKVGDWVVTPRIGKPVEIQALWYNALRIMQDIATRAGKPTTKYKKLADQAQKSFLTKFAAENTTGLLDVVDGPNGNEYLTRPNQIFALSLSFPVVDPKSPLAKSIIATVKDRLATVKGLRTLAQGEPGYCGRYGPGNQAVRDGAYHQGTVWPWLLGAYIDAYRAVQGDNGATEVVAGVSDMLLEYGVGSLAEIYDGDDPHGPNGCIAQAWSVAELLRALTGR